MQRSIGWHTDGWHTDALRMRAQGKGADEIAAQLAFSQQYQSARGGHYRRNNPSPSR
jgi:hypothetical protein